MANPVNGHRPRRFKSTRIVIAGCGQVGKALLEQFPNRHFIATYRPGPESSAKADALRAAGARAVACDLNNPKSLAKLARVAHRVVWMAPPNAESAADNSLSRFALHALSSGVPQQPIVTYISTTGVYGNAQGEWLTERDPVNPQSDRARRRVHAERQLRSLLPLGVSVHLLRAPGIYSAQRLPLERLRLGTPAIQTEDDSWSNHIHEVDLGRLAVWANFKGGAFQVLNACDDSPMKMGDYFDLVADTHQLPRPPRLAREEVRLKVSPMMWSFMSESRKIKSINQQRLGFRLKYPSVADCLSRVSAE